MSALLWHLRRAGPSPEHRTDKQRHMEICLLHTPLGREQEVFFRFPVTIFSLELLLPLQSLEEALRTLASSQHTPVCLHTSWLSPGNGVCLKWPHCLLHHVCLRNSGDSRESYTQLHFIRAADTCKIPRQIIHFLCLVHTKDSDKTTDNKQILSKAEKCNLSAGIDAYFICYFWKSWLSKNIYSYSLMLYVICFSSDAS